jgi:hypothetical protein
LFEQAVSVSKTKIPFSREAVMKVVAEFVVCDDQVRPYLDRHISEALLN